MSVFRTRRGKIRLKSNGAEIYQMPSAQEQLSAAQFTKLGKTLANVRRHYTGKLDGFVLVAWDHEGTWLCDACSGTAKHSLTLPEFVADAVRQDYAKYITGQMFDNALE